MKTEKVGIVERAYNGNVGKALKTSRGIFKRVNKHWELLHQDGSPTAFWGYIDGRYVRACAKYSDVLVEYNQLMGRSS